MNSSICFPFNETMLAFQTVRLCSTMGSQQFVDAKHNSFIFLSRTAVANDQETGVTQTSFREIKVAQTNTALF